ncbi:hypothetical protein DSM112329_02453 [Paraconexibacter sp. AEG42_29]|uniref:Histidine phosphotransferase ChpT C-terminal domain-containing protein n=1 Tax=Paraconexibacter sp. AEG42_29 TaxID=2997339 RepID=A0AAU7AV81_9ACTN
MSPRPRFLSTISEQACPGLGDVLLALAAEFGATTTGRVDDDLDARALQAMPARGQDALAQATALRAALCDIDRAPTGHGTRAFRVDMAVADLRADPLLLVVIGAEVAARAGLRFGVSASGKEHLLVFRGPTGPAGPVALDLAHPARPILTGDAVPTPLVRRCGHQLAFALLNGLAVDAWLAGDLANAEHACDLRLQLPIDGATRERIELEAKRLRASRN